MISSIIQQMIQYSLATSLDFLIIQGGRLIWFPPYMVWLFSTCKGYDSSIIILKNGHNLGSDYHFLMKLSGLFNDG